MNHDCREKELNVLLFISIGLVLILLGIILGIYLTPRALPNWAENVLVSIGTAGALKLGDCLSTLVALSSGRQQSRATELVAQAPAKPASDGEPQVVIVEQPVDKPIPVETAEERPA